MRYAPLVSSLYHTPRYKCVTQKGFLKKFSKNFFLLFNILFAENGDAQEQAESDSNKRGNDKAKHVGICLVGTAAYVSMSVIDLRGVI